MAGDAVLLKISASTVMTMIDQSGLRTKPSFSAVRDVLSAAMAGRDSASGAI
jgi:hypothetical protein